MNILRSFLSFLSSNLLKLSLIGLAIALALVSVMGQPGTIKQNLQESGVYDNSVGKVLDLAVKDNEAAFADIPLDQAKVQETARKAFTPLNVEIWTGEVIDGFYGWLDGTTPKPQFNIDLAPSEQIFIQTIADEAEARLKALRPCTMQENLQLSRQASGQAIDPFTIPCRPPIDITAEKQRLVRELENKPSLLGDKRFTLDDIVPAASQAELETNSLPQTFQWIKRSPLIFIIVAGLSLFSLVMLERDKRRGIKKAGIVVLGTGLFLLLTTLIFNYLFNDINRADGVLGKLLAVDGGSLQTALLTVTNSLFEAINMKIIVTSLIYSGAGAFILFVLYITRPKNRDGSN